ncbi:hypothetical protein L195_g024633 [Trifolium pratense]|uniref:Reverse transcriptase Ty1/copia-type domain-containing protein n=1 Tax=Trifolium pratense TaxID=57577 RepID=A0A2K3NE79_TRIPR|nr:hypothetical protein L195_g024633 [Trifolium pratense]
MTTVRALLPVTVNCGWSLSQMDVKNTYLHGDLEEEVYMKLLLVDPQSSDSFMVYKLHKPTYGLKQSPHAWHAKLSSSLQELGFLRSATYSSLFDISNETLVVLVYVDDLILIGNSSSKGLFLNQHKYILDLHEDVEMTNCKPTLTPLDSKLNLDTASAPLHDINDYQQLVGSIGRGIVLAKNGHTNNCKKHVCSSVEAEYHVMASAACEMIWLEGLLADLGFPTSLPMTTKQAMHIAANPVFHE